MTSEEMDRVVEVRDAVACAIDALVLELLEAAKLTREQDTTVREMLNEQYRFWS